MSQYGKIQSNTDTDIFRIGPIPVSPITTRSESARHFDNCKEKSREIVDWLINKGIITWCFSYWPSYRSSVCCIGVRMRLGPITKPIWKTSRNNTIIQERIVKLKKLQKLYIKTRINILKSLGDIEPVKFSNTIQLSPF